MFDETRQQTGEARRRSEAADGAGPRLGGVAQILGGLAGVAVLITGAALLTGWAYTTALYDRLGIPTRALELGPADYATAKVEIWLAFALGGLAGLAGVVMVRQSALLVDAAGAPAWWPRSVAWSRRWSMAAVFAGMLAIVAGTIGVQRTGQENFLALLSMGLVLGAMGAWSSSRAVQPHWLRPFLAWAAAGIAIMAVLSLNVGAEALGRHDAEALLAGPEEGRGARFVAGEPLGLPGERYESDVYVTDSVGVVRATDNAYFVVVRGTKTVYSLPAARVLRVEYTPHEGR